ncbi:aspartate kinase [Heyndrickxia oleronia]|uniref:aspartate kinase n=1 Tax=Heyndrickxia oleronia TaxID=38875 RepID=UPI002042409E|nr:aspartate kinase [Heyndrickxia oleronia]MCM3452838.1 aspartate kinase [Heyndrickxia oleronia]
MKVVKFGGSSLATGEQVKKVFDIVMSDPMRKIVVVSAPGKRYPEDEKITDLLISCGKYYLKNRTLGHAFKKIVERYTIIANDLNLSRELIDQIKEEFVRVLNQDFSNPIIYLEAVKASGEDVNAKLVAAYFQQCGVEASYMNPRDAGLLVSNEPGNAQVLPESYNNLANLRNHPGIIIFPGFFGFNQNGEALTFSRSGSDITGSVLANGVKSTIYENFTDVDAVYSVNPMIIENPKEIREITYREMRELSYAGFCVLHDEALIPAYRAGIPVHIKNTNNPSAPGTKIVFERVQKNGPVVGIASDNGFCSIYVSKYLMNREVGFGRRLLHILEKFNLSYEHSPSGIDDISIILRESQLNKEMEKEIVDYIKYELDADEVKMEHGLALIMIVGEGMRRFVGTAARASKALAENNINIEMINQGSSEVSMMFGVKEMDEVKAVQALYQEFFARVLI